MEALGFDFDEIDPVFLTVTKDEDAEFDLDRLLVCAVGVIVALIFEEAQVEGVDTDVSKDLVD